MMISGDAIGSGDDIWLFNDESFFAYDKSIKKLIQYIRNPENGIDEKELAIYGGHYWQKGPIDTLQANTIYDMKALIEKIGDGTAEIKDLKTFIPFLNASFKFQSAGIAWNKEAAERYKDEVSNN